MGGSLYLLCKEFLCICHGGGGGGGGVIHTNEGGGGLLIENTIIPVSNSDTAANNFVKGG